MYTKFVRNILDKGEKTIVVVSAMSHLRFCRAILSRDSDARQSTACDFIVARCDFDAACDKQTWLPAIRMTLRQSRSQRPCKPRTRPYRLFGRSVRPWSCTLRLCRASKSRDKIARQNRRCHMALRYPVIFFSKEGNEGGSWGIRQLTSHNHKSSVSCGI